MGRRITSLTCREFTSASEKTATVLMPNLLAVRTTLHVISPLFAINTLSIPFGGEPEAKDYNETGKLERDGGLKLGFQK